MHFHLYPRTKRRVRNIPEERNVTLRKGESGKRQNELRFWVTFILHPEEMNSLTSDSNYTFKITFLFGSLKRMFLLLLCGTSKWRGFHSNFSCSIIWGQMNDSISYQLFLLIASLPANNFSFFLKKRNRPTKWASWEMDFHSLASIKLVADCGSHSNRKGLSLEY